MDKRLWVVCAGLIGVLLALYLFLCHYVHNYSDPLGFVGRAMAYGAGRDAFSRAPLYPPILHMLMNFLGRDWVYLSNLPFVLLLAALVGCAASRLSDKSFQPFHIRLLAFSSVAILILARKDLLLELVNPYREPLAFSFMLGSVILLLWGWHRRGAPGWLMLSGLSLGLATSMRETGLLLAAPIGLWMLAEMIRAKRIRMVTILLFALGLLIGLSPLLKRNYAYSGSAVVPSYAADRVEQLADRGEWDIPVPGMSLRHFNDVGPETLRQLGITYRVPGLALFLLGIAWAIKRRNVALLALFLPAALITLLFYCFYWYYKSRYLLGAEIFAIPIMAYGLVCLVQWLEAALARFRPVAVLRMRWIVMGGLCLAVAGPLATAIVRGDDRTKVWHLQTLRDQILPHIQQPATFVGHRHFSFRMAQLLEQHAYEYGSHFYYDSSGIASLDERLRRQGARTLETFSEGNYYVNDPRFALGLNWLELTPVFSFDSLDVPSEIYGRRDRGFLHHITLWQSTNLVMEVGRDPSRPALFMVDMKRIWDYPDRTVCVMTDAADASTYTLTNGFQLIELAADARGPFHVDSDANLPRDPYRRLVHLNDEFDLIFGMGGEHWAASLLSDELFPNTGVPSDACQLYDRGSMLLPVFADRDHDVYADLRVEFVQDHPHWRSMEHRLHARAGEHSASIRLPPRRRQATVTVKLGRGTGRLTMAPVELETTLPSHAEQSTRAFWRQCPRHGFVKLYDAHIFSAPIRAELPVHVDVGSSHDGMHIVEGFHARERSGAKTVRWTDGLGVVRVRLPAIDEAVLMRWYSVPVRPGQTELTPVFAVNEVAVPFDAVERYEEDGLWVYQFYIEPDSILPDDLNRVSVQVPVFKPSLEMGSSDQRDLGLLIERLVIERP